MWATKQLLLYFYLPVANKISFVKSRRNRDLSVKASSGTLIRLNVDREVLGLILETFQACYMVCLLELLLRERERILNHFVYWKLFQKYFQWECIKVAVTFYIEHWVMSRFFSLSWRDKIKNQIMHNIKMGEIWLNWNN